MAAFECRPCGKTFSGMMPYSQHLVSEKHKKKLRNQGIDPVVSSEVVQIAKLAASSNVGQQSAVQPKCVLCNITFPSHMEALRHGDSALHKQRLANPNLHKPAAEIPPTAQETDEDKRIVKKILEEHRREFVVCPLHMTFKDFILEKSIFPLTPTPQKGL